MSVNVSKSLYSLRKLPAQSRLKATVNAVLEAGIRVLLAEGIGFEVTISGPGHGPNPPSPSAAMWSTGFYLIRIQISAPSWNSNGSGLALTESLDFYNNTWNLIKFIFFACATTSTDGTIDYSCRITLVYRSRFFCCDPSNIRLAKAVCTTCQFRAWAKMP